MKYEGLRTAIITNYHLSDNTSIKISLAVILCMVDEMESQGVDVGIAVETFTGTTERLKTVYEKYGLG